MPGLHSDSISYFEVGQTNSARQDVREGIEYIDLETADVEPVF